MEPAHRPQTRIEQTNLSDYPTVLSSGQAALRYHFEDLIREHHAERRLEGSLALRGAGLVTRLARPSGRDVTHPEAVILAGGMTEGEPAEALILSQLLERNEKGGSERFVLPIQGVALDAPSAHIAPWIFARSHERFVAPVGVIGLVRDTQGDDVIPAYSPQAQEEALDHIEIIADLVNTHGRQGGGPWLQTTASSVLLARVLDKVVESNAAGDPEIYGAGMRHGAPLLSILYLGLERGRELAFNIEVVAIRLGEKLPAKSESPLFSGGLFLKEYTVAARRGPLAFEDLRIVDLVERAA